MAQSEPNEPTFFERERDRLTASITSSFEELLSSTNQLNRQVEGVVGMTKEYETIATFWEGFRGMMESRQGAAGASDPDGGQEGKDGARQSSGGRDSVGDDADEEDGPGGLPGTGGHHVGSGRK